MSTHFCRIGKIKPNIKKFKNAKELQTKISNFVDDVSKVVYSEDLNTSF